MVLESIVNRDMPLIREYMAKGVELRVEGTRKLTEIQASCDASQKYQEECDMERKDTTKRVGVLEVWRSNQAAAVDMRTSIVAGLTTLATLALAAVGLKYGGK